MKFAVRMEGREREVTIRRRNGYFDFELDGRTLKVDCQFLGASGYLSLLIDNRSYLVESGAVDADDGRYYARVMGRTYSVDVLDELLAAVRDARSDADTSGASVIRAPMPGLAVEVRVAPGDTIQPGDTVVVIEAMKMQNELTSDVGGVVAEVFVSPGNTVESQAQLVRIEIS